MVDKHFSDPYVSSAVSDRVRSQHVCELAVALAIALFNQKLTPGRADLKVKRE